MNKLKKPFKILILIILGIILLIGVFIVGVIYKEYSRSFVSYNIYENSLILFPNKGKVRLKNRNTDKYITPKLDYIFRNITNPVTVYKLDNKRGYLNQQSGEIVIDSKKHNFLYAWEFDPETGLAAVVENNLLGFIDSSGQYRIKPQFKFHFSSFSNLGFRFNNGYSLIPGADGNVGVVDTTGNIVLEPLYSLISNAYRNKLRVVQQRIDNRLICGLVDSTFNFVLPLEYNSIEPSKYGIIVSKNNIKSLISYDDYVTVITTRIWDEIEPMYYQQEGMSEETCSKIFSGLFRVNLDYKYGVIDSNGQVLINPDWDNVECLNPNMFEAKENGESYLVDRKGEYIR